MKMATAAKNPICLSATETSKTKLESPFPSTLPSSAKLEKLLAVQEKAKPKKVTAYWAQGAPGHARTTQLWLCRLL
jgi:hypothetical protein